MLDILPLLCYHFAMKSLAIVLGVLILVAVPCAGTLLYLQMASASKEPQVGLSLEGAKPKEVPLPSKEELLKLVNDERSKVGVAPLTENALLSNSAQYKADDEIKLGYFGHTRPGESTNNGLDYLNSIDGTMCKSISENLHDSSGYYSTANGAVESWVKSREHYQAMVNPKYSYTGFGVKKSGDRVTIVQHFCEQ